MESVTPGDFERERTKPAASRQEQRRRPAAAVVDNTGPRLSVVLPVLNEEKDIGRLLSELKNQVEPPGGYEAIVVDGGSTDATRAIVQEMQRDWSNLHLADNPRKLSSAGRNAGAQLARGDYVLFLDGHCSIGRQDYLRRSVDLFESSKAACLCRPQPLKRLADSTWGKAISSARHSFLGHDYGSDIYGCEPSYTDPRSAGAAYSREVLEQLGGYDERFDACEDVEFNHRVAVAGFKSYRHPDLSVDYRPRRTLGGFFKQMMRYGRGRARMMARHSGAAPWPLIAATALMFGAIALLPIVGWKATALWMGILGGMGLLVASVESVRLGGLSIQSARIASAFVVIYSGLLLGFWRGILEFKRFRAPKAPGEISGARTLRPAAVVSKYSPFDSHNDATT